MFVASVFVRRKKHRGKDKIYEDYDFVRRWNLQRPRAGWMGEKGRKRKGIIKMN